MVDREEPPQVRIEKNVPVPAARGYATKYPFGQMEVGDSIQLPDKRSYTQAVAASQKFRKQNGWKFAARSTPDGFRIWRIA